MRTVNNSKRPINIKNEQNHLAPLVKLAKLSTGLTDPIAGPIFPKEEAAAPNADIKSKPKNVRITEETIKISMQITKKERMLKTMG